MRGREGGGEGEREEVRGREGKRREVRGEGKRRVGEEVREGGR